MKQIFFRLPFQDEILTIESVLGNTDQVVFHSFDDREEVQLSGTIQRISKKELLNQDFTLNLFSEKFTENTDDKRSYQVKINKAIQIIDQNQLPKLVLSRRKWIPLKKLDLIRTFLNLCQDYPNTFAYLFLDTETGWIGATPEILGSYQSNVFTTMSLAGTLPLDRPWTKKEIDEQQTVTSYISAILKEYATDMKISQPHDHLSGNIKHLRTDFKATVDYSNFDKLIAHLHPTPAVCGIPKVFCEKHICQLEDSSRKFYSGYIKIKTQEQTNCFVNLRCGELYNNGILLYSGGGITSLSNPETEWKETELKCEAVSDRLVF